MEKFILDNADKYSRDELTKIIKSKISWDKFDKIILIKFEEGE